MINYKPRLIIFTDGSINKDRAGSAAVIYDTKKMTRRSITRYEDSSTNNRGELTGIEIAFEAISTYHRDTEILIVSDSKYAIQILERFIKYAEKMIRKFENPYEGVWLSHVDNRPYKNQELIKDIHKNHLAEFTDVRYIHINSHLKLNKKKDVEMVVKKMAKQGLAIDDDTARGLIKGNQEADNLAKEACS